ncbi:Spore development regulator RYP2 [Erysiphe necator]|nr:Spore development regulator RYP2 [Erysiphe necator]
MASAQSRQQYAGAMASQVSGLSSENCEIIIRQEPNCARVSLGKDKERKPVDPPPIIQLKVNPNIDPKQTFLQSPYIFMSCSLIGPNDHNQPPGTLGASLTGTVVSSLHRLKDTDNQDGGFFVWGDLSVKIEGHFRFRFILFEIFEDHVWYIKDIVSSPFPIFSSKNFPGNPETTFLTRSFGDQGIKVRVRKEHRTLMRKRGLAHDDFESQHYGPRKTNSSQARSKQTSRDIQETIRPIECQNDSVDTCYDTRSQFERNYSSQSPPSYGCSIPYEESSKRSRNSSESAQIPTYGQSLGYTTRQYVDTQSNAFLSYNSQSQQAGAFSYTCEPSPIFSQSTAPRQQFFTHQIDTGEPPPPYDLHAQRSPTSTFFPSHQHTAYSNTVIPHLSRIDSTQSTYDTLGISSRGQSSPTGISSMSDMAPFYTRLNSGVSYSNVSLSSSDRRDAYQTYPVQASFSNDPNGFLARHPGVTTIDGSTALEGAF